MLPSVGVALLQGLYKSKKRSLELAMQVFSRNWSARPNWALAKGAMVRVRVALKPLSENRLGCRGRAGSVKRDFYNSESLSY